MSRWIPTDTTPAKGRGLGKKTTQGTPSNSTGSLQAPTCQAGWLWYCSLSKHLHLFHKLNPSLSAIRRKCRSFSDSSVGKSPALINPLTPRRSLTVQPLWIHMVSITSWEARLEVRVFSALRSAQGREGRVCKYSFQNCPFP